MDRVSALRSPGTGLYHLWSPELEQGRELDWQPAGTIIAFASVYIVIMLGLGYLGYKRTKEAEDYLVAGRKAHPVIIALSYGATFISTSAIAGFGGQAANIGMDLIWLTVFNIGVGILLAFVIFGKKTREIGHRLRAVTFPVLMGKVYQSQFMQVVSGLVILVGMPLYTAAVLIGEPSSSRKQ
jgi:SSS family solute:Na+ symporter